MTRQHFMVLAVITAALSLAPDVRAQQHPPVPPPKLSDDVSACAKVTASARYEGYGYTHLIELKNTCDKAVECKVWTNVDPEKITLRANPKESASVVTRKGSPSREVSAQSECKLAP